jgi:hypothetical protein
MAMTGLRLGQESRKRLEIVIAMKRLMKSGERYGRKPQTVTGESKEESTNHEKWQSGSNIIHIAII